MLKMNLPNILNMKIAKDIQKPHYSFLTNIMIMIVSLKSTFLNKCIGLLKLL